MILVRTLISEYGYCIEHNGIKAILLFKNINDVLYWTKKHNILFKNFLEIRNKDSFKNHLKKHNLHIAIYNKENDKADIFDLEQL